MTLRHAYPRATKTSTDSIGISAGPAFMASPDRACRTVDPDLFYSVQDTDQELAKVVCGHCPFRQDCATWALANGEQHGIWGGVLMSSPDERRQAREDFHVTAQVPKPKPKPVRVSRQQAKADLERKVREGWEKGQDDATIALNIGITHNGACNIRTRLGLPALKGPGGRRIRTAVAA